MSRRGRFVLLLPALAVFAAILFAGLAGIPDFGHYRGPYGDVLNRVAVPERHVTNVVAATVFDYRGFDTLGEEFILFTAVLGVVLLLREQADRGESGVEEETGSEALRELGLLLLGPAVVICLWLVAFGYLTPGGPFQGGVALAGATLLLYLAWSYRLWHRATPERVADPVEALGAGGFVVIGLVALATGAAFLTVLLGLGTPGSLVAGGTIPLLNWAVALEVVAANVVMFREFLESHLVPLSGE